ncbi:hypothetical protein [Daejeonella sp.]|jgi:hypothetical protein|uniref:hypothetical protein n=1 Tax=Daejeonella sp. TaxID=2805397 RepID=UPI0037C0D827
MNTLKIEISDQEYLIKLKKDDFSLSLIKNLVKRVKEEHNQELSEINYGSEDLKYSQLNYDSTSRFDYLGDK